MIMLRFNEVLAFALDYVKRAAAWIKDAAGKLYRSAVAVYSSPLTWLAVCAVFVVGYATGFGQGIHGKRELRQRVVMATTTRDIAVKRVGDLLAERNALADRIRTLEKRIEETASHPVGPPPPSVKRSARRTSSESRP